MSTAVAGPAIAGEIEVLREQARAVHRVVRGNTEGLTQEDSLIQPQPGGNCLNWVVGHLVCIYDLVLPMVGQQPVLGADKLKRYSRGSGELHDSAAGLPLEQLMSAWEEAAQRYEAGLASITSERLDQPAPFSPRNNPNETVRSLLSVVSFHQAYHAGQTGLLRRMAGKQGFMK